ncbi:MAG TPA: LLM class F420-dependent oxidoreductase [Methylomirabilota bacterium]|jgi:probable F420-dependent oxidoreductase
MDFGFAFPGRGPLATPEILTKLARKADELRYSSIFVTDHVVIPASQSAPYPYSPTGKFAGDWKNGYLEPLTLMSYLAGETSRVRLGTSVLVIPYRNPVVTAKMLATLDVLSGGRVILGAGVGWFKEEFEALHAEPFERRGAVTDEYLQLMRACWTQEPVDWQGAFYRMSPVSAMPKPRQKGSIPIWVGGHTDAALRRAGELSDGWHPIGLRPPAMLLPEEYRDKVAIVRDWARKAGREPNAVTLSFRCPLEVLPKRAKPAGGERQLFRGTAAEVIGDVKTYQALGVTHFVFDPIAPDLKGWLAMMERFADEVRPRVQRTSGPRATSP